MINLRKVKKYCKEYTKIENYDLAVSDTTQTWHCHHRDEVRTLPSGMVVLRTVEELKENGRYYDCPPNELIFLTKSEHSRLHSGNINEDTRMKLSIATKLNKKGNNYTKGRTRSKFGKAFKEHYGISEADDKKLYKREHEYYRRNGKFKWEVK